MSIFGFLGGIFAKILSIGQVLLPIIEAFRAASPDVDKVLDKVDHIIEEGGEAADDFFDRNLDTIYGMREFYRDMQIAGATGEAFIDSAIQASQVDTPDSITPEEAQLVGAKLLTHKDAIRGFFSNQEQLAAGLKAMK